MPRSRPLWSATFVTGLADGGTGLVVIMDHVLADGIAGLAVLGTLADQVAGTARPGRTGSRHRHLECGNSPPMPGEAACAGRGRPDQVLRARRGPAPDPRGNGGTGGRPAAAPAAGDIANRPVGPRRRLDVVAVDLAAIRDLARPRRHRQRRGARCGRRGAANPAGRARGATRRGHHHGPGGRAAGGYRRRARQPDRDHAGHRARHRRLRRPGNPDGPDHPRAQVACPRRLGRPVRAGVPVAARTGLLRWFTRHQRAVQTFVTNLRGPQDPLTFGGATVRAIIPIPSTTGNVTVTFAAASYAGTLRITICPTPPACPTPPSWPPPSAANCPPR